MKEKAYGEPAALLPLKKETGISTLRFPFRSKTIPMK